MKITKKQKQDDVIKTFIVKVPNRVNDVLKDRARQESERLSVRVTKDRLVERLLKKFADGEVEIRGGLFLLL